MNQVNINTKKCSGGQSRRTWNAHEEQELLSGLKDLPARGYKSENGYRTGYFQILEQFMAQRFPGTDLKAEPHIVSKIHNWKRSYNSLSTMFSTSGIGLRPNFMLDVQNEVWDNYVKWDNTVRNMRYKTWPYYNDWVEIFGKDRATGEVAQGFADAMKDFLNTGDTKPVRTEFMASPNANEESSTVFTSHGNASSSTTSKRCGKAKQPRYEIDDDDPFMSKMSEFCEKNDKQMGDLAVKIGVIAEKKESNDNPTNERKQVYKMLKRFDFPSLEARVHVARYLCNNESDLDLFMSIPHDARIVLVKDIMDKI